MRIDNAERQAIVCAIKALDPKAEIYLFGSRTDPTKRGGDIDILIISDVLTSSDKLVILSTIFEYIEEQKIDLVIVQDDTGPFARLALKTGIKL